MNDPAAEASEAARSAMLTLLDTVVAENEGRLVLSWRVDAKMAQASLLTRATFNDDRDDAEWASRLAIREVASCKGLLLS